jgi:hypothetical protein
VIQIFLLKKRRELEDQYKSIPPLVSSLSSFIAASIPGKGIPVVMGTDVDVPDVVTVVEVDETEADVVVVDAGGGMGAIAETEGAAGEGFGAGVTGAFSF